MRQTVTFAVETKDGAVARTGRSWMAVPEVRFRGGEIKWYEDRYREHVNGVKAGAGVEGRLLG